MFNNKSILITGGTGSFGKSFVKSLLSLKKNKPRRIIVFSRDELKQSKMSEIYSEEKYPNIRYFLGDVRDRQRVKMSLEDVDYVVHAAALKQIPAAEYNPIEYIKTNIVGAQNIIEAALEKTKVKKIIALSTDKASSPANLYGATKLCSDKLFTNAIHLVGNKRKLLFSVVRYGNVFGSSGSVVPYFLSKKKNEHLPITDLNMTRFNILMDDAIEMVLFALKKAFGGEIFVPKLASYRISDLIKAMGKNKKTKITGKRPGEKLHEELISSSESSNTFDVKKYYVIAAIKKTYAEYAKRGHKKIKNNFSYNSLDNTKYLSVNDLRKILKKYIADI